MSEWQEFLQKQLQDPEFRKEWERWGPLYAIIGDVLRLRYDLGLSQAQLAQRMGKKQPAIARFEAGNAENPTLGFIQQLAEALGVELSIRLVPKAGAHKDVKRIAEGRATYSPS